MFETRIQTYWDDADAAGRVYFANFFRFVEYAEAELFRSTGNDRMRVCAEHNVWLPRVESFAKFSKPILVEEAIYAQICVKFKGEKTVRMDFRILSADDRSLLAEGYVTAVCMDRANSKSRPLPLAMREIFALAATNNQNTDAQNECE